MKKILEPKEIFSEITDDYKSIYENHLISIILYGSGAGTDYHPDRSNLDFLIVLSEEAIDQLEKAFDIVSRWRKKNVTVPLFMTRFYIDSSCDSYPLEFLNMQKSYTVVYGEDVLKTISFKKEELRCQCEREIKGKLLLLRKGFLMTGGKRARIQELISESITAFISIFRGLLYLKDIEAPNSAESVIEVTAREFSFEKDTFLRCFLIKMGEVPSHQDITIVFKAYLKEVRKLSKHIDSFVESSD
ncbi:MAG: hypothetical protein M0P57_06235 [Syntrophales bacterium]|jgi:hypothetical protein|nr:hypothetical protein [Syntrophales bacterium]MDY0043635.1 hypothetical protein [Syntrophales bacterium]